MTTSSIGNGSAPPKPTLPTSASELLASIIDLSSGVMGVEVIGSIVFMAIGYYLFNILRGKHHELPDQVIKRVKSLTLIVSVPRAALNSPSLTLATDGTRPVLKVYTQWFIDIDASLRLGGSSMLNLGTARVAARLANIYRLWLPMSNRSAFYAGLLVYCFLVFLIFVFKQQAAPPDPRAMKLAWMLSLTVLLLPAFLLWFFNLRWSTEQADLAQLLQQKARNKDEDKHDLQNVIFADE